MKRNPSPFEKPVFNEQLVFGKAHTDHIFECNYENNGWGNPEINPFHNFSINPMNTTLHYALCCFEGIENPIV